MSCMTILLKRHDATEGREGLGEREGGKWQVGGFGLLNNTWSQ